MKILVARFDESNISTTTDYTDIKDRGEISHIYMVLELIQADLLRMWEEWDETHD